MPGCSDRPSPSVRPELDAGVTIGSEARRFRDGSVPKCADFTPPVPGFSTGAPSPPPAPDLKPRTNSSVIRKALHLPRGIRPVTNPCLGSAPHLPHVFPTFGMFPHCPPLPLPNTRARHFVELMCAGEKRLRNSSSQGSRSASSVTPPWTAPEESGTSSGGDW